MATKCKLQPSVQLPVEETEDSNPIFGFFQTFLMPFTSQHSQLFAMFGVLSIVSYFVYRYSKYINETETIEVKYYEDSKIESASSVTVQENNSSETLVHRKIKNDNVPIVHEKFECTCPAEDEHTILPNSSKKPLAPKAPANVSEFENLKQSLLEGASESSKTLVENAQATFNTVVSEIENKITEMPIKAEETLKEVVNEIQNSVSQVAQSIEPLVQEIEREVSSTLNEDIKKADDNKLQSASQETAMSLEGDIKKADDNKLQSASQETAMSLEGDIKKVDDNKLQSASQETSLKKRFSIESLKIEQSLAPEVAKEMSPPVIMEREPSFGCMKKRKIEKNNSLLELYDAKHVNAIEDHFSSLSEIASAINSAGLEKSQLIFGIDFTISNLENGTNTFNGRSLHYCDETIKNPYQKVIEIMGKTLEKFDMDGKIPAFGFGDSKTKDRRVFSFSTQGHCKGFKDVLAQYDKLLPTLQLSGPTNFAPLIREAIKIVKATKQYHILVIVADGQVTNERQTREAIVEASKYPISIIMVGVGDGPWNMMNEFDDSLPKRQFDNFQFVNYHKVTEGTDKPDEVFALNSLMEIPDQYKAIKDLKLLD